LDWSAVFLRDNKGVDKKAIGRRRLCCVLHCMATMRLFGDRIVSKTKARMLCIYEVLSRSQGFMLVVFAPWLFAVLIGLCSYGVAQRTSYRFFYRSWSHKKT